MVLSTVHSRSSLLSCGAPALGFFTDARVLNTVMTRAQSQVVAVGNAVALCSFGACSKLWKSFIRECVKHRSVWPESLSLEHIEQSAVQSRRQHWALHAERSVAAVAQDTVPEEGIAGALATEHVATDKVAPGAEGRTSPSKTLAAGDEATQSIEAGDAALVSVAGGCRVVRETAMVPPEAEDMTSAGKSSVGGRGPGEGSGRAAGLGRWGPRGPRGL